MRPGASRIGWAGPAALAVLCATLAAARLAGAQGAADDDPLTAAEAAYGDVDFEGTLRFAGEALERGGNSRARLTRIYELMGISAAALEQEDAAREAYVRMLALEPEARLDRNLAPRLRGPFLEARGYWAAHSDRLSATVALVRGRSALRVDLSDPIGMARSVVVRSRQVGEDEFVESHSAASAQTYVEVEGARSGSGVEYSLQVLDQYGNAIIEIGSDDDPRTVGRREGQGPGPGPSGGGTQRRPFVSTPWFWVVVGGAAAVVAGATIATGVVLADQAQTQGIATDVTVGVR